MGKNILSVAIFVGTILSLISSAWGSPDQTWLLDQKKPSSLAKRRKPIDFRLIEELHIDAIRKPSKVLIQEDRLFILDRALSQVLVTNLKGSLLSAIGRPGQGPGDLERPKDMMLAPDGSLYILNPAAKRIEVFARDGAFRGRIKLKPPRSLVFSNPDGFLVLPNRNLLLTYSFSPHLIDEYGPSGRFISEWIPRDLPIADSGRNLGNSSSLLSLRPGAFLLLDRFRGLFLTLDSSGQKVTEFSVYSRIHAKNSKAVLDSMSGDPRPSALHVDTILQWSTPFLDTNGDILVFSLFDKEGDAQKLFAFSPDGNYLYCTFLIPFRGMEIVQAYSSGDLFVFITAEDDIYLAIREAYDEER